MISARKKLLNGGPELEKLSLPDALDLLAVASGSRMLTEKDLDLLEEIGG